MEILEREGKKYIKCEEVRDTIRGLLFELDELMDDLKILDIPIAKEKERKRHFKDVMATIFKLNGMDYDILRGLDKKGVPRYSSCLYVNDTFKSALKECCDVIDEANEFLKDFT